MCAVASGGSSAASPRAAAPLPAESRLARSLERGYFARTFSTWEQIGSGAFGTVVKAWHVVEGKWYALKVIHARARASETIEDNCEAWSGPEVFKRLRGLRGPHVVRYVRYWSELPGDLPCQTERQPAANSQHLKTAGVASAVSGYSLAESDDGGFEWAPPSWEQSKLGAGDVPSSAASTAASPHQMHSVVILEQMEYCEGVTLQTWLEHPECRPGLSFASQDGVLTLFTEIMKGLAELHEAGIVHCDIKPANILITKQDSLVKLCDIGSARVRAKVSQRCGSRAPLSASHQVGSCTALGTPGYAPPEHCTFPAALLLNRQFSDSTWGSQGSEAPRSSRAACPGSDIFSAGVVLVELLMASVVGGAAWSTAMERAGALARLRTGRGGALPRAVLRTPGIGGWLRQLVLRMVVWDAEVRPSASEVLDELEAGLWTASRHNPNVGMSHPRAPQLAAMSCPCSAAHNPYIGFFLDHRGSIFERAVSI